MFIALKVSIEVIAALRPIVEALGRLDAGLADQIRRAATSAALNLAEGAKRNGKDRPHHYRVAAGSAAEVRAALAVAAAWGHLDATTHAALDVPLDRQAAVLYRLINPR